ncbi:MAG: endonuclease/exonuclease/phosphatase family protein [Planctomycetes bacterium]|nr:endonuclease/exonuclease/phosphatase family protein [Planctomycetota bacterium]
MKQDSSLAKICLKCNFAVFICTGLATILTLLAGVHWVFDLFSHFRFQYFWLLLLTLLIYITFKRYRMALVTVIFAGINIVDIFPYYFGREYTDNPTVYKTAFINLRTSNDSYSSVLDFINQNKPDFLLIAEVNTAWFNTLKPLTNIYKHHLAKIRDDNFGVLFLSRFPIAGGKIFYFEHGNIPAVDANIKLESATIRIVGIHLMPPIGSARAKIRNKQFEEIIGKVSDSRESVILIGDLNTTSWSPYFKTLLEKTGLKDSRKGFGIQPTWPTFYPPFLIPLDHCLVSKGIVILNRQTGPYIGSDHYPILIEFTLKNN